MSFSSVRRALPRRAAVVAASIAICGVSLALASSASATQMPVGSSTDSSSAQTLYGASASAAGTLYQAASELASAGDTSMSSITSASDVTTSNAAQIVADYTDSTFEGVSPDPDSGSYDQTITNSDFGGNENAFESSFATYEAPGVVFLEVPSLIALASDDPTDYPNGLYTVYGDLAVSSAATVTTKSAPTAFSITEATTAAATGGYVLPSAFTLTFPDDYSVNAALIGKEISASQEGDPPSTDAIGSVTVLSPAAIAYGLSSTDKVSGKVYIVAAPSATAPSLELYFGDGIYNLGAFSTPLKFPLTVSFGEVQVGMSSDPLPLSSISMTYPAKTSPVEATSCSNLGTPGATATDVAAPVASQQFFNSDGLQFGVPEPLTLPSTATVVTDLCAPSVSKLSVSALKSGKPTLKGTIAGNGGTSFTATTITLPKGVSAKGLKASDLKVSGAKLKSVKVSGQSVTLTFTAATKKATLSFTKKLSATAKTEKAKSLAFKVTVKTAAGTSSSASVSAKA